MGWYLVTVAGDGGEALASAIVGRANEPATWSFENLGAIVFRQKRADEQAFYFCPRARLMFESLIASLGGRPCASPLMRTLLQPTASRLVLGFKTNWEPVKRPERKPSMGAWIKLGA